MRRAGAVLWLVVLGACGESGSGDVRGAGEHPFLLVRASEYEELRQRAQVSPWRELAQEAERYAREEEFDPFASDFAAFRRMLELCGALGIAALVAPAPEWAEKLADTLAQWDGYYRATAPSGDGVLVRWQQSAMVESILALDILRDELAPARRDTLEAMLDPMLRGWWTERAQDGTTSTPGVVALWAIYSGDEGLAGEATRLFRERLFTELTPAGVFDSGSGYAWVRQGGDRISKYALVDVLEYTGRDRTLYPDPRLVTLHEWMYGGAFTPARRNPTFGDSDPTRPVEALLGYLQPYRAGRFSERAGRNAAWLVRDVAPRTLVSSFLLMDDTLLAPAAPASRLWDDTASLFEDAGEPDSLAAHLWSARTSGSHSHHDANAVHLYAYGRNVLRNSGYCGSGEGIDATFDWDWVHATAEASNTAVLAGAEHTGPEGGGLVDGLVGGTVEFASASSGPALAGGEHRRELLLVHGDAEQPGYFALLDELRSDAAGVEARLFLHPDSASVTTVAAGERYAWTIGSGGAAVALDVFLATPPLTAELRDGGLCAFDGNEYVARYLRSAHSTGAERAVRALTVLFPSDAAHAMPQLAREGGAGFSGARVSGASTTDHLFESAGTGLHTVGPESFRARGAWYRERGGRITGYLLVRGRAFASARATALSFASTEDLSALVEGSVLRVHSSGARVTVEDPALLGSSFANEAGTVLSAAPGRVEIELEPGRFALDLATGEILP